MSRILAKDSDGDHDVDGLLERTGCAPVYAALEACLAEHNGGGARWSKCKKEVAAWRSCFAKTGQRGDGVGGGGGGAPTSAVKTAATTATRPAAKQ